MNQIHGEMSYSLQGCEIQSGESDLWAEQNNGRKSRESSANQRLGGGHQDFDQQGEGRKHRAGKASDSHTNVFVFFSVILLSINLNVFII